MSTAGRCIARSTSSGTVVGPGMARNSRPARTTIVIFPSWYDGTCWHGRAVSVDTANSVAAFYAGGSEEESGYLLVSRQPAASASSTEQNQRVPLLMCIWIFAYQRLWGVW